LLFEVKREESLSNRQKKRALLKFPPIESNKVAQSQGNGACVFGTKDMRSKFAALKLLGKKIPDYRFSSLHKSLNPLRICLYLSQIIHNRISAHKDLWFLLLPLAFLNYGFDFIKRLCRKVVWKLFKKT